jgi:hypothetical protein
MLLDVAGEDEDAPDGPGSGVSVGRERRRDSTALTVVEVDTSTVRDALVARPTYRVVDRREWVGTKHTALHRTLVDLARNVWHARYVVVDATGIGAGLASFLGAALGKGCALRLLTEVEERPGVGVPGSDRVGEVQGVRGRGDR